jgi:hypothetical protein
MIPAFHPDNRQLELFWFIYNFCELDGSLGFHDEWLG